MQGIKVIPQWVQGIVLIAMLSCLSGCGGGSQKTLYEIDFSKPTYPDFVDEITGLSGRESWGRWSDADIAPAVTIRFKKLLPKHFTLVIKAQALPDHGAAWVKIGGFKQEIFIHGVGDTTKVYPDLSAQPNTIQIIPEKPTSPQSLGINDDPRKLGIGLMRVVVEN